MSKGVQMRLNGGKGWTSGWASGDSYWGSSNISKPAVQSHQVSY